MKKEVIIIDYGTNNILSLKNAFKLLNIETILTKNPDDILNAQKIVLPGVGAFEKAMKELNKLGFSDALKIANNKNIPILGICLGMQLIMSSSSEFGEHKGLNLIEGSVKKIPQNNKGSTKRKIPHVGWNKLKTNIQSESNLKDYFEKSEKINEFYYFVHSFYASPNSEKNIVSYSEYQDFLFPSIISKRNLYGVQFHPEKSGKVGLEFLSIFGSL